MSDNLNTFDQEARAERQAQREAEHNRQYWLRPLLMKLREAYTLSQEIDLRDLPLKWDAVICELETVLEAKIKLLSEEIE